MVHTYEVQVDFKEYLDGMNSTIGTACYEIHAETKSGANSDARYQALHDHPKASEFDVRIIRLLR